MSLSVIVDGRWLQIVRDVRQECHNTFVTCFDVFYPSGPLKWAILCELLDQIEKFSVLAFKNFCFRVHALFARHLLLQVAKAAVNSQLLAAVLDSLCNLQKPLRASVPYLSDLPEKLQLHTNHYSPDMERVPSLSSPLEYDNKTPLSSHSLKHCPVLIQHMVRYY